MKRRLTQWIEKYLNDQLDLREQIFHLLILIGMTLGVVIGISSFFTNAGTLSIVVNLLTSVAAFSMLEYSSRTGQNKRLYLISVILVFLIAFPVLFFTSGGPHGGTPSFFVFALVFTVFMLEGKTMVIVAALELIVYIGICVIAYRYPGTVMYFETERDTILDIIIGFTVASAALGITANRYARIYDKKQKQLAEANAALDRINHMKTQFLGNISHELKTPLAVISGYAQANEKSLSDLPHNPNLAEMERSMRLIASEADRLALMVTQVLDVTRIEEGRMSFNMQPAPLSRILHNTLQTYYPVSEKNGNTLAVARGGASPTVVCDPERISQVLVNLISNAARHTHNGEITIGVAETDGFAEVSVTDTGEGIPPDRRAQLFERYKTSVKSKDARAGRETGTGLGLYICKHIVEEHGGQISLASEVGKGTTVRFTIPLHS